MAAGCHGRLGGNEDQAFRDTPALLLSPGILCLSVGDGRYNRTWLLVNEDRGLPQIIRQIEKLEDVTAVSRHDAEHAVFAQLEGFFQPVEPTSGKGLMRY